MNQARAYGLAGLAIVLWSTLASFAALQAERDPLLTTGIGLCIGGALSLPRWRTWLVPWPTWTVGLAGLFGYHALYFNAFTCAPAIDVNVLNYLWPVLMMALAPLIVGGGLKPRQLAGTLLGLLGTITLLAGSHLHFSMHYLLGYGMAICAALVWAIYSLLSKRLPPFPSSAVGGFCMMSGIMALAIVGSHQSLLGEVRGLQHHEWYGLIAMGIGPLGISFYCWDAALKHGDPTVIAALSYLTPLLSTIGLLAFGGQQLHPHTAYGLLIILCGAILGSWPSSPRAHCDDTHGTASENSRGTRHKPNQGTPKH
jgi:drug/metabolite transporter (DMT)-like permease